MIDYLAIHHKWGRLPFLISVAVVWLMPSCIKVIRRRILMMAGERRGVVLVWGLEGRDGVRKGGVGIFGAEVIIK